MAGEAVAAAIEAARERDNRDPPDFSERYTAWHAGRPDQALGFALGSAGWQCSDRIAPVLYEIHAVAGYTVNLPKRRKDALEWAFTMAASYAKSCRMRYALEWGRQAAADGLVLGLMDREDTRGEIGLLSNEERAEQFGVGRNRYGRIRGHVRNLTRALLSEYEGFVKDGLD